MSRTTELPKGESHAFQKLWMERKGNGPNNWSVAKKQPKWLCFENLCFNSQSGYISNKLFLFWLINVRLAGSRNRLFLPCLCFFSVGEELTLLSLHGKIQPRSFKATSDDTRGLFAGNVRPLSPLKFLSPLSDIILLVHSDLLWVEYRWKRPVYYLCYPIQGLHDVFGVEMLRTYV